MELHERIVHLGLALQNREREFHHFHDELVDALIEGDGERAGALTESALRGGQRKVMEALADSAAGFRWAAWISIRRELLPGRADSE